MADLAAATGIPFRTLTDMSLAQVNLLSAAVARRDAAQDLRTLRNLSAVVSAALARDSSGARGLDDLWAELRAQLTA